MKNISRQFIQLVVIVSFIAPAWLRAAEAPFEKEIQAFEQQDKAHFPQRDAVLFVGSSTVPVRPQERRLL